jgi:hypothetical protein
VIAASLWDRALLGVELHGVHVRGDSVVETWREIGTQYGVRTVLVTLETEGASSPDPPFAYDSNACKVEDMLRRYVTQYGNYTYTSDPATGVTWLHPRSLDYLDILREKVVVRTEIRNVPMFLGVMGRANALLQPAITSHLGSGMAGEMYQNYPVDIAAGEYSLRDIVNACCAAHPNRTFHVRQFQGTWDISPTSVTGFFLARRVVSPGALLYWQTAVRATPRAPSLTDLIDALSSSDERIRRAARSYIDFARDQVSVDQLISVAGLEDRGAWTAIGIVAMSCGLRGTAPRQTVLAMRKLVAEAGLAPGLKAVLAMELARTGDSTSYALRCSPSLRAKLLQLAPSWSGASNAEIESFGSTNAIVLP